MAQDYFVGNTSYFSVNGSTVHSKGWSVDPKGEEQRTDNTSSGGYSDRVVGVKDIAATIEMDWDASANPLDNPPNLGVGSILTNVRLYANGTSSPYWGLPIAIVLGTPNESKVGSVSKFTFNIANKGAYTKPTGNFTPA